MGYLISAKDFWAAVSRQTPAHVHACSRASTGIPKISSAVFLFSIWEMWLYQGYCGALLRVLYTVEGNMAVDLCVRRHKGDVQEPAMITVVMVPSVVRYPISLMRLSVARCFEVLQTMKAINWRPIFPHVIISTLTWDQHLWWQCKFTPPSYRELAKWPSYNYSHNVQLLQYFGAHSDCFSWPPFCRCKTVGQSTTECIQLYNLVYLLMGRARVASHNNAHRCVD